jgi:hypothetical protein
VEVGFSGAPFKEYHVINAKGVAIDIANTTNASWKPGEALNVGDKLEIRFDGIKTPLEKIAGIYNPGFPDTCYVRYDSPFGEVRGDGVQYDLSEKNAITVTVPDSLSVELSKGVIDCGHMGDPLGSHRTRPGHEPVYPNFNAKSLSGTYCVLPDILLLHPSDSGGDEPGGNTTAGSGGGCDFGFGAWVIVASGVVVVLRKVWGHRA